jgi:hypothetical protein
MPQVSLSPLGGAASQFFDNNGVILSGGKIYTYAAGTTTPQTTYTSVSGVTPHANPIILDSAGRVPGGQIWAANTLVYKFTIETSAAVLLGTYDNVSGITDLATLAASNGADLIGFLQSGTGAVARTLQAKGRDVVSATDFGAVGNGVADDRIVLQTLLATTGAKLIPNGTFNVSGGAVNPNPAISDPEPSALTVTASNVTIEGSGSIVGTQADKGIVHVKNATEGSRPTNVVVRDITVGQAYGDPAASGLNDDYFSLRFEGSRQCRVESVTFLPCELGITFQFTQTVAYSDRTSKRNVSTNCIAPSVAFMFLQLFGEQSGVHTGHTAYGVDADGTSRAAAHFIRLIGFSFAECLDNIVSGTGTRFLTGLSLQGYASRNQIDIVSNDCTQGCNVSRQTTAAEVQKNNQIKLTTYLGDYGLYDDGGSYNQFELDIVDPIIRGINATNGGAISGLATGNSYKGKIRKTTTGGTARLAVLGGNETTIDLDLEGNGSTGSDTQYGLLTTGGAYYGRVSAKDCQIGVQLGHVGGTLFVDTANCGTDLVIAAAASNLTVYCNCTGNVAIASGATNIKLIGYVGGTVTNSAGAETNLSQLNNKYGSSTAATDVNGFVTITHGLGRTPVNVKVTSRDNSNRAITVTTLGATTFIVRVWTGPASPLVSTSTSFMWEAY